MPSSSSLCSTSILSSAEKLTASPWVPSRNVVSKVKTLIWVGGLCSGGYADFFFLLEERHHFAQLRAHLLDGLVLRGFTHGQELVTAGLVLRNPILGELAGLNLGKNLLHLGAGLFVDDAGTARVVAVLRRIRYREAHVAEAAFINKIDNQLQFV